MPESIRDLAFLNAVALDTGLDFEPHSGRLVREITNRFPLDDTHQPSVPLAKPRDGVAATPAWHRRHPALIAALASACIIAAVAIYLFSSAAPLQIASGLHDANWKAAQGDIANKQEDYDTALQWYRKAADAGNVHAKTQLGVYYQAGRGVDEDDAKAFQWTNEAAHEGDVRGMHNLAELYFFGIGTPRDNVQSAIWYRKAAELGSSASEAALGIAYQDGFGVPKDEALSLHWYQKAADHGNADAAERLGELYDVGSGGVSKDPSLARYWMTKAAQEGHSDAKAWLRDNPERN